MAVINENGQLIAHYHKTHLFNAYKWQESRDTIEGDRFFEPILNAISMLGLRIRSLRFPEAAR